MEESILIDKDFQSRVNYEWHSSDFGLNSLLEIEDDSIKTCKKIVSGASLRNAGDYQVKSVITNSQRTFSSISHVQFTPNKCHWFEVGATNAFSGRRVINELPGAEDIEFELKLQQNKQVDCEDFNFYDRFNSIDFKFVVESSDETFIDVQPSVTVQIVSLASSIDRNQTEAEQTAEEEESARTSKDIVIKCSIPKSEQYKIPVWQDVKILMSLDWVSSKYNSSEQHPKSIFQNAMYTIQLNPLNRVLKPELT